MPVLAIELIGQPHHRVVQRAGNDHDFESGPRLEEVRDGAIAARLDRRRAGSVGIEGRQRRQGENFPGARPNGDARNAEGVFSIRRQRRFEKVLDAESIEHDVQPSRGSTS
jgi:hypothetical protein